VFKILNIEMIIISNTKENSDVSLVTLEEITGADLGQPNSEKNKEAVTFRILEDCILYPKLSDHIPIMTTIREKQKKALTGDYVNASWIRKKQKRQLNIAFLNQLSTRALNSGKR